VAAPPNGHSGGEENALLEYLCAYSKRGRKDLLFIIEENQRPRSAVVTRKI
jgi:hypothetical protein